MVTALKMSGATQHRAEERIVTDAMTTNESFFFRDKNAV